LSSELSEQESVSRRKFLRKIALATAAGAGVAGAGVNLVIPSAAAGTDQLVKATSTDSTAGYLSGNTNPKIVSGTRVATTVLTSPPGFPTGYQQLQISISDEVMPAEYVIYMIGSTILVRNGLTGKDDYSGTDAATVIQNAINALPSNGGLIFLKAGTYPITTSGQSPIAVPSGVTLQGEGIDRTIITSPLGFFYAKYSGAPNSSSQVSNIAIRDMTLQSNGTTTNGGYFFTADYGANSLRFERLKMLGGGNVGTGVVCFRGQGTPPGTYSDIQFIDVWADSQGTIGNEFFVFDNYNLSNIKFKRCYIKNSGVSGVGGANVGFYQLASASNVAFRDCTLEHGRIYMGVFGNALPVVGRLSFDDCYFISNAGFGTGASSMQWIEVYFRGCISDNPFGVGDAGVYHVYLSDSWALGTMAPNIQNGSAGYVANPGNITIRGGGMVDGWNTGNYPSYSGGSAISVPTGQLALSQLLLDVSGFRIGTPAANASQPGGILINYTSTSQNLRMKIADSFMPMKGPSPNFYNVVCVYSAPGGPYYGSGPNWLNQLVAQGLMPTQHTLIGLTDETGKQYAYTQGIASIPTPASGTAYQNVDGVSEAVYIVGGALNQVVKNGVTLFTTTNVTVWLEPGESVTVTYSSAPTMFADRK